MLRKFATSMLLTGAVVASGSTGCGSSSEVPLGQRADELVIEAPAQPEAAILGSGFDKTSGAFTKACVTGTGSRVGPSSASLTLSRVTTLSSLESSMGFAGDLKARYAVAGGTLAGSFAQSAKEDAYSDVFAFQANYNLGFDRFPDSGVVLTDIGKRARDAGTWSSVCGDEYVDQIQKGARLYFLYRIDFASRIDKEKFNAAARFDGSFGLLDIDASVQAANASNKYLRRATIHVEAFQLGGDPGKLTTLLAAPRRVLLGKTASAAADCSLDRMDACQQMLRNALSYASGSFASQLAASQGTDVNYITKPYSALALPNPPREVSATLKDARAVVSQRFDALLMARTRVRRLIGSLSRFHVGSDQEAELKRWESKLTTDLSFVLTEAIPACYDNISFDMAKVPATPLGAQVATCDAKARAIPTDLPPADLLTAGGRFAINSKWRSLGGNASVVGAPATRRTCTGRAPLPTFCFDQEIVESVGPERVGLYQEYRAGRIYWHPDVDNGAHEVHGAILDKYKLLGHANGLLGFPVSDELDALFGGRKSLFQFGSIYWHPSTGAYEIHGDIDGKWTSLGYEGSVLGYPTSDEQNTVDGMGRVSYFQRGYLLWRPDLKCASPGSLDSRCAVAYDRAKLIKNGPVADAYAANGGYQGWLGYPSSDVLDRPAGGQYAHFANGSIFHNPLFGSFTVADDFRRRHHSKAGVDGWLGYPIAGEEGTAVGYGRMQRFQYGAIYRHPSGHVASADSLLWNKYVSLGRENGFIRGPGVSLGLPVAEEPSRPTAMPGEADRGWMVHFERGDIILYPLPSRAVYVVAGLFRDRYEAVGRTNYGLPTSDPRFGTQTFGHDYWYQSFERGCIATCTSINTVHSFSGTCDISRIEDLCD